MSWIWLDGVEAFEKAKFIRAWKKWESTFPQIYLIEFIAQAGAILLGAESSFEQDVVFIKIEEAEFFELPRAGERLEIVSEPQGLRQEGGWFLGKVSQAGKKILEVRVLLMNIGRLRSDRVGPITFPRTLVEGIKQHGLKIEPLEIS